MGTGSVGETAVGSTLLLMRQGRAGEGRQLEPRYRAWASVRPWDLLCTRQVRPMGACSYEACVLAPRLPREMAEMP